MKPSSLSVEFKTSEFRKYFCEHGRQKSVRKESGGSVVFVNMVDKKICAKSVQEVVFVNMVDE